jgi:hypothetical protein
MKSLYKTTIVIWTEYNPDLLEIEALAREAMAGDAYCSRQDLELVVHPEKDADWDGTEFFAYLDEEESDDA